MRSFVVVDKLKLNLLKVGPYGVVLPDAWVLLYVHMRKILKKRE